LANEPIAASRVGASPRNGASAAVFVVLAYRRGGSLYDADTAPSASPAAHAATANWDNVVETESSLEMLVARFNQFERI
jgi:hypothetical protein